MQVSITKRFRFEAAHQLMHHDGKCARLHGHSWVGEVTVTAPTLHKDGPKQGMIMDYADLSALLKPIIDNYLDHHMLNTTCESDMPTSEAVAFWLFEMVKYLLAKSHPTVVLSKVAIEETCTSRCEVTP